MRVALIGLLLALPACAEPVQLQVEHQKQPLAVGVSAPRFAWQESSTRAGWRQTAYTVQVATAPDRLDHADVWDSGRVERSESVDIAYAGPALAPDSHFVWRVTTWDEQGHAMQSAVASFDTAPARWDARWIRPDDAVARRELEVTRWVWLGQAQGTGPQHVSLRTRVHLQDVPRMALLHVVAKGSFVARVNGQESGRHTGWNAFDCEPVTELLHAGDNEIEVAITTEPASAGTVEGALAAALDMDAGEGRMRHVVTGEAPWEARADAGAAWAPVKVLGPLALPLGTAVDRKTAVPGPDRIDTTASLLRKTFELRGRVRSAKLTITAMGAYSAFLNGKAVAGDNLLDPGFTDFRKRVLYQTYDVTALVHTGRNALGAMLGGGWHGSPMTWQGTRDFAGPELLSARLEVVLEGGQHVRFTTDRTWKSAPAPVLSSEIYGGEVYDARAEVPAWTTAGFDDADWPAAVEADAPAAELTAQPDLSIHRTATLHPVSVHRVGASYVLDMGQNMVGNIALQVTGPRGTAVRMRYAERLNPDGSIYTENLRNAAATDTYVLKGGGRESYTPWFTFHGFRYVELSGYPGTPTPASVQGLVYNSLPETPSLRFHSASSLLNSMGALGFWGQRGNFVSIPTDCPQRDERLGWMGDAGVFWRTGTYNFDIASFTDKFMLDIADAQQRSGDFSDVSPDVLEWGYGAPGWADAGVLVPYAAWLQYGDTADLARHWDAMNRFMAFLSEANPNFLRTQHLGNNYADWLAPDPNTPKELIGTAYWALLARDMQQMAEALHDDTHARAYAALFGNIREAYQKAYVHADGSVSGNTQSSYVVTLYAGLAPEGSRSAMVQRLVHDIEAHGNHLTTGFLGTPFLLSVLDTNGRSDVAFRLLLQSTYPSWGYMVDKGATTWWERWNGDTGDPSMNSYNHYSFGSVMAWVFRRAAGIDSTDGSGFHHLVIAPHFDPSLPQLDMDYASPYGLVTTHHEGQRFEVTLPANTTAELQLPGQTPVEIGSGKHVYTLP